MSLHCMYTVREMISIEQKLSEALSERKNESNPEIGKITFKEFGSNATKNAPVNLVSLKRTCNAACRLSSCSIFRASVYFPSFHAATLGTNLTFGFKTIRLKCKEN